ncbi:MAG: hypothetical protein ABJA35_06390 [Parafilimonas sp.]
MGKESFSQPNLESNAVREIIIKYDNKEESYTLLQDAVNKSQWYYIPKEPRLNEILIDGKPNPEFTLLRYQFVDPQSTSHSFDGGIMQFSIVLSPEPKALKSLDSTAKMEIGNPNLSLAALPLKSAQASIYTLGGDDSSRLVSKSFGTGLFPTFASQKAPFALYLTRWGADINDALIGNSVVSNTGIPIAITFTYQGLTPPASLKIMANYHKIFQLS